MIPENSCTADIGTDHGFVPLSLITEGTAERAIASDVRKGPLERAEARVRRAGLSEQIECRLGDGLSVLSPGEAEVIVIAGMGGMLMVRILREGLETARTARTLILSPHRDVCELRQFLSEEGFRITDEALVSEDGKYYPVIRAESGGEKERLTEEELRFGPVLLRKRPEIFQAYLNDLESKLETEIAHLSAQKESSKSAQALKEKREELSLVHQAQKPHTPEGSVTIRRMEEKDLTPLAALLSDPKVMEYLEAPYSLEQSESFLKKAGLSDPPLVYAAEEDGRFVGYVIFHEYEEDSLEIGWVLQKDRWGNGLASRLTELLIQKGREMEKDLIIECDPGQETTRHLAGKFGFTYEGQKDGLDIFRLRRVQT